MSNTTTPAIMTPMTIDTPATRLAWFRELFEDAVAANDQEAARLIGWEIIRLHVTVVVPAPVTLAEAKEKARVDAALYAIVDDAESAFNSACEAFGEDHPVTDALRKGLHAAMLAVLNVVG